MELIRILSFVFILVRIEAALIVIGLLVLEVIKQSINPLTIYLDKVKQLG